MKLFYLTLKEERKNDLKYAFPVFRIVECTYEALKIGSCQN
jgi:hypothetical protein